MEQHFDQKYVFNQKVSPTEISGESKICFPTDTPKALQNALLYKHIVKNILKSTWAPFVYNRG